MSIMEYSVGSTEVLSVMSIRNYSEGSSEV